MEKEKEKRELLDRFEKEKIERDKREKELMKQIELLLTKVGNTTTINNNIIIRNFGEENVSYLTDTFLEK